MPGAGSRAGRTVRVAASTAGPATDVWPDRQPECGIDRRPRPSPLLRCRTLRPAALVFMANDPAESVIQKAARRDIPNVASRPRTHPETRANAPRGCGSQETCVPGSRATWMVLRASALARKGASRRAADAGRPCDAPAECAAGSTGRGGTGRSAASRRSDAAAGGWAGRDGRGGVASRVVRSDQKDDPSPRLPAGLLPVPTTHGSVTRAALLPVSEGQRAIQILHAPPTWATT